MFDLFSGLKNYRKSLMIVVVLLCTMVAVSFVYEYKIGEIMVSAMRQEVVLKARGEMESVNHNFRRLTSTLKMAAWDIARSSYIGSTQTIEAVNELSRVTGFLDVGIADLNGRTVYGFELDGDSFAKLSKVFDGSVVVTLLPSPGGTGYNVLLAAPVFSNVRHIHYTVYIRATGEEFLDYFRKSSLYKDDEGDYSVSFLLFGNRDVVHISKKTMGILLTKYVVEDMIAPRFESGGSFNGNNVEVYRGGGYRAHYMTVTELPSEGWSFVYMVPAAEMNANIRSIMTMFAFLMVGVLMILTILLLYYEYTAETSKKRIYNMAFFDEFTGLPNTINVKNSYAWKYQNVYQHNRKMYFMVDVIISNYHMIHNLLGTETAGRFELQLASTLKDMESMERRGFAPFRGSNSFFIIMRADDQMPGDFKALPDDKTPPFAGMPPEDRKEIDAKKQVVMTLHKLFAQARTAKNEKGEDIKYTASFSAGVCQFSSAAHPEDIDKLMECCSNALFFPGAAEDHGNDKIAFYDAAMKQQIEKENDYEKELVPAIGKGEFLVYLQPKYDMATNRLAGAEALIRWKRHGDKFLSPGEFVPVFEKNGSIAHVDNFIFVHVRDLLGEWSQRKDLRMIPISVNFSQVQFRNPNLMRELKDRIKGHEDVLKYLDIEITESATTDNRETVKEILTELKQLGFKLSMDDFGTGYSNLSNITMYPFDTIKIDKSFVDKIDPEKRDSPDVLLVKDVVQMTKDLGKHSLVEGVENKAQRDVLRDLGCEYCQGYYYSRPLPIAEFEKLLKEDKVFEDKK